MSTARAKPAFAFASKSVKKAQAGAPPIGVYANLIAPPAAFAMPIAAPTAAIQLMAPSAAPLALSNDARLVATAAANVMDVLGASSGAAGTRKESEFNDVVEKRRQAKRAEDEDKQRRRRAEKEQKARDANEAERRRVEEEQRAREVEEAERRIPMPTLKRTVDNRLVEATVMVNPDKRYTYYKKRPYFLVHRKVVDFVNRLHVFDERDVIMRPDDISGDMADAILGKLGAEKFVFQGGIVGKEIRYTYRQRDEVKHWLWYGFMRERVVNPPASATEGGIPLSKFMEQESSFYDANPYTITNGYPDAAANLFEANAALDDYLFDPALLSHPLTAPETASAYLPLLGAETLAPSPPPETSFFSADPYDIPDGKQPITTGPVPIIVDASPPKPQVEATTEVAKKPEAKKAKKTKKSDVKAKKTGKKEKPEVVVIDDPTAVEAVVDPFEGVAAILNALDEVFEDPDPSIELHGSMLFVLAAVMSRWQLEEREVLAMKVTSNLSKSRMKRNILAAVYFFVLCAQQAHKNGERKEQLREFLGGRTFGRAWTRGGFGDVADAPIKDGTTQEILRRLFAGRGKTPASVFASACLPLGGVQEWTLSDTQREAFFSELEWDLSNMLANAPRWMTWFRSFRILSTQDIVGSVRSIRWYHRNRAEEVGLETQYAAVSDCVDTLWWNSSAKTFTDNRVGSSQLAGLSRLALKTVVFFRYPAKLGNLIGDVTFPQVECVKLHGLTLDGARRVLQDVASGTWRRLFPALAEIQFSLEDAQGRRPRSLPPAQWFLMALRLFAPVCFDGDVDVVTPSRREIVLKHVVFDAYATPTEVVKEQTIKTALGKAGGSAKLLDIFPDKYRKSYQQNKKALKKTRKGVMKTLRKCTLVEWCRLMGNFAKTYDSAVPHGEPVVCTTDVWDGFFTLFNGLLHAFDGLLQNNKRPMDILAKIKDVMMLCFPYLLTWDELPQVRPVHIRIKQGNEEPRVVQFGARGSNKVPNEYFFDPHGVHHMLEATFTYFFVSPNCSVVDDGVDLQRWQRCLLRRLRWVHVSQHVPLNVLGVLTVVEEAEDTNDLFDGRQHKDTHRWTVRVLLGNNQKLQLQMFIRQSVFAIRESEAVFNVGGAAEGRQLIRYKIENYRAQLKHQRKQEKHKR